MRNLFRHYLHILSFFLVLTAVFAVGRHGATACAAGADRLYYFNMDVNGGTQGTLILVESNGSWGLLDAGHRYADTIQDADGRLISVPQSLGLSSQISMRNGRDVANYMINQLGVTHLDFIVGSHAHSDHVGGVPEIATTAFVDANGDTRYLVDGNTTYYYKEYQHIANFEDDLETFSNTSWHNQAFAWQATETMRNQGANLVDVSKQQVISGDPGNAYGDYITFTMGDMSFRLYNIYEQTNAGNENVNSIVTVMTNGDYTVVNLADIDTGNGAIDRTSEAISKDFGTVDVVVAGHHGYAGSNTKTMFDELQPDYVVISNGKDNNTFIYTRNDLAAAVPYAQDFFGTRFYSTALSPYAIVTDLSGNQVYVYNLEGNGTLTDAFYKTIKRSKTTGWISWINTEGTLWTYLENGNPRRNTWKQDKGKWYHFGSDGIMQTGWISVDGRQYYLRDDGAMQTGWLEQDGKWYYLNTDNGGTKNYGKMVTGWKTIKNKRYFFDGNGIMAANTWVDGCYVSDSGAMVKGWLEQDGKWYYLNPDSNSKNYGKKTSGWKSVKDKWYYFNPEDGIMLTDTWVGACYVKSDGAMAKGWLQLGDDWYYLDKNNGKTKKGWLNVGNKRYFFGDDGVMLHDTWVGNRYVKSDGSMAKGWLELDGKWYRLNDDGKAQKGWQNVGNKRYFFGDDGVMLHDTWVGNRYVKSDGAMAKGWLELDGKWYCLNDDGKAQKGWQTIKNKRYYFDGNGVMAANTWVDGRYVNENGVMVTGWVQLGDSWYYLNKYGGDKNGKAMTGWQKINNKWYYFEGDGRMVSNSWADGCYLNGDGLMATGWLQLGESWYYLNPQSGKSFGKAMTGWQQIGGKWYYFDDSGIMARNTAVEGYYLADDGSMITGWRQMEDGNWYYMNVKGEKQTGWQQLNGKWYYFDENGVMASNTWVDGYYLSENGSTLKGWQQLDGRWYYLNEKGERQTGWQQVDGKWYCFDADGVMLKNTWVDGCYVTEDGNMLTGWQMIDGSWYYLDAKGKKQTGWQQVDGKWYYFDENGVMASNTWVDGYYLSESGSSLRSGWQQVDGNWYYLNEKGEKQTGWQQIDDKWYYLGDDGVMAKNIWVEGCYLSDSGAMLTGWQQIDGGWYYLNNQGKVQTGWQQMNGSWYYLSSDGVMQTGWVDVDGSTYYLSESGAMLTGWQWFGDQCYYFYGDGRLARDTVVEGYYVDGNGVWIQDAA